MNADDLAVALFHVLRHPSGEALLAFADWLERERHPLGRAVGQVVRRADEEGPDPAEVELHGVDLAQRLARARALCGRTNSVLRLFGVRRCPKCFGSGVVPTGSHIPHEDQGSPIIHRWQYDCPSPLCGPCGRTGMLPVVEEAG